MNEAVRWGLVTMCVGVSCSVIAYYETLYWGVYFALAASIAGTVALKDGKKS